MAPHGRWEKIAVEAGPQRRGPAASINVPMPRLLPMRWRLVPASCHARGPLSETQPDVRFETLLTLANAALEALGQHHAARESRPGSAPDYFDDEVPESMLRSLLRHAIPELIGAGQAKLADDIRAALGPGALHRGE